MKKTKLILAILCLFGLTAIAQNAQTVTNTVTGKISDIRPFNDQFSMTVGDTFMVLIVNRNDPAKEKGFEINKEYKDLLVKNKAGKYELNPKYSGKIFNITYYINGKGWKCIKEVKLSEQF